MGSGLSLSSGSTLFGPGRTYWDYTDTNTRTSAGGNCYNGRGGEFSAQDVNERHYERYSPARNYTGGGYKYNRDRRGFSDFNGRYNTRYSGLNSNDNLNGSPTTRNALSTSPDSYCPRPRILFYTDCSRDDYDYESQVKLDQPHFGFTNFSRHGVVFEGKRYPTGEHLFQAFKFIDYRPLIADHIRTFSDLPRIARTEAHKLQAEQRVDWKEVKIEKMELMLYLKFTQHEELIEELVSTGDAELIEVCWNFF
ncbi:uncharacterized protein C8R40DRAFT_1033043 [Lentinula edodes]|uniref:uncharacterized protein n=1 Tax=Lentinula edodes TaxID=5353 RepID=UPI001E8ECD06|nr:uncharacterized protein C8R40DRAFT_1033043 [Lentinula edodes]KAH7880323.1 hypothetical protein C8R40DRAFT_1033043 [Lentinula edodes]